MTPSTWPEGEGGMRDARGGLVRGGVRGATCMMSQGHSLLSPWVHRLSLQTGIVPGLPDRCIAFEHPMPVITLAPPSPRLSAWPRPMATAAWRFWSLWRSRPQCSQPALAVQLKPQPSFACSQQNVRLLSDLPRSS